MVYKFIVLWGKLNLLVTNLVDSWSFVDRDTFEKLTIVIVFANYINDGVVIEKFECSG